jgi:hypothetical protein
MLYIKVYNDIIERAKSRKLLEYTEKHHIIPKCMGGNDDKDNLVKLTFREHFICHRLLCKIYPNSYKLYYALSCMIRVSKTNLKRTEILTSRHFNLIKNLMVGHMGKWNLGKVPWNKGLTGKDHTDRYKFRSNPPNMLGRKWINNGKLQRKIFINGELPEGWIMGRIGFSENNPMKNKDIALKNSNIRKENYRRNR